MEPILIAKNLTKSYTKGLRALDNVSLTVNPGKVLVVMGPSGSGKSTLIRTFNGLETFDQGELNILGITIDSTQDERKIQQIRKRVGMVFQQFNLFPHLSILENITLAPIHVQKRRQIEAEEFGMYLLSQMGIDSHATKYPSQLSGGEQQRVAIARAIAMKPQLILADEPTGNLDTENSIMISEILFKYVKEEGSSLIMVTHDQKLASKAKRKIKIKDGKIK